MNSHQKAFESLLHVKVGDFRRAGKLKNAVLLKIDSVPNECFHEAECERFARFFVRLVEDVLGGRYGEVSLRAFTHACSALDYFLNPHDERDDNRPGGLEDDAKIMRDVFSRFQGEFEAYQEWNKRVETETNSF